MGWGTYGNRSYSSNKLTMRSILINAFALNMNALGKKWAAI
jgi:hypothetical protein